MVELDLLGGDIELRGREPAELLPDLHGGEMRHAADRRGETAGIIAGGDRPGIARGVQVSDDADVGRLEAERVSDDLRQHGAVALALRHRGDMHGDAAERIERDGRGRLRAILRPGLAPLLRRQHGGDVAHVGDARLHHGGQADTVETALRARLRLPLAQLGKAAVGERGLEGLQVIAGIERGAARGAIGKRGGGDQVLAHHRERIEAELDGHTLHQPLQRVIDLRAAETAVEAGWRLVGEHDAVAHRQMADVVGAGEVAVHAVERRRLRRADVGADVLELVPGKRLHAPVGIDGGLQRGHAVGR